MAAKLKYYDGSKWVKPSEVNANPTLAGTETELSGLEIDGVKYKIPVGGGSAIGSSSSAELPSYVEITTTLTASGSVDATIYATMTEENLGVFIDTANLQLSPLGYTLTKQNWSTLIPQLATAVPQLRYALIQGFIRLSTNSCAEDIDGYSSMVYVSALLGTIKVGNDTNNYDTITDSHITPISNHY